MKIEPPEFCPSCSFPTSMDGAYLVCTGSSCPAQISGHLLNYLRALDVKGFGESTITHLVNNGSLERLDCFYCLKPTDFESTVMGEKLLAEFENKAREIALPVFIDALGIHGVGQHLAELAMMVFPSLDDLRKATVEQLVAIQGIGPELAKLFVEGLAERSAVIDKLLQHVKLAELRAKVKATGTKCTGQTYCFTGFRDKSLECWIEEQNGNVAPSMNKSVTHLVAKSVDGESKKLQKAREKGLAVLSQAELEKMAQ